MRSIKVMSGQRGDVTDLPPLGHVAQQSAHDPAGPRLRQLGHDQDAARLDHRTDLAPWPDRSSHPPRPTTAAPATSG